MAGALIEAGVELLVERRALERIWSKDGSVFSDDADEQALCAERLGWLDVGETMPPQVPLIRAFVQSVLEDGFTHVVLCGMGGSSLAAEVYVQVFGVAPGHPELIVLDTTDPARIAAVEQQVFLTRTLFVIASKSGGTYETDCLRRYFTKRVGDAGVADVGTRFAAITDPGSALGDRAVAEGYRAVFENPADIGGRYSALSLFGLVPAALIGVDVDAVLASAAREAALCAPGEAADSSEAFQLGAAMGALAAAGIDKLAMLVSPSVSSLAVWAEQLIAESTGKQGRGIVPILGASATADVVDRMYVQMAPQGEPCPPAPVDAPRLHCLLAYPSGIGGVFFRLEMATALASIVLGVEPFDQKDVAAAKEATAEVLAGGAGLDETLLAATESLAVAAPAPTDLEPGLAPAVLSAFLSRCDPGSHVALLVYVPDAPAHAEGIAAIQQSIGRRTGAACSASVGPRYLHSSGQLHKGGPDAITVVILEAPSTADVPIPGRDVTFAQVFAAQAEGDARALVRRGRPLLRVRITGDVADGIQKLAAALD